MGRLIVNYFKKNKKTAVFFSAVLFVMPDFIFACDYDGVCEPGERKDNCIFDCMVATNTKEVKIAACNYNISLITRFDIHNNPTTITDGQAIFDFLRNKEYIDLLDGDEINAFGSSKKLSDNVSDIPIIIYWWGLGLMPYYCSYPNDYRYPICMSAEDGTHEDWFLHQFDFLPVKENRVRRHWYGGYIWDNSNANWRSAFTDAVQTFYSANPHVDGIFYDETQVRMNTGLLVTNRTENQTVKEGTDGKGNAFKYLNTDYPTYIYTGEGNPLIVTNKNNPTKTYQVAPWPGTNNVYFEEDVAVETEVTVNYYFLATVDQNVLDNWGANYTDLLRLTREKVGGKLIIFNGFYGTYDHESFFQYADGGMKEGIFGYAISETKWKEQLDQLADYSARKIHYSLSYSEGVPTDQMQKHALFAFTSFLLGKGRYAYFQYTQSCQHFYWFDYWKTPLGCPKETCHIKGTYNGATIYEREYRKVLVLVNPGDNDSGTIDLVRTYKTVTGSSVSSISLGAKEGILLIKEWPCPIARMLGDNDPNVERLRDFRDNRLVHSAVGRIIIQMYDNNADSIDAALDRSPALRAVARRVLEVCAPLVGNEE